MKLGYIGVFQVLGRTFGGYRLHLILLVALGFMSAILEGIGVNAIIPLLPFLLGTGGEVPTDFISRALYDMFLFFGVPFSLRSILIFISALFLVRAALVAVFAYIRTRINASFMYREMGIMLSDMLHARWPFLASQKAGYLQNTLFWDVRQTTNLLDSIAQFIQSSTGFLMYLFVAFSISSTITLVTLGAGVVLVLGLQPLVRKTRVLFEEVSGLEKMYTSHLIEHLGGLKTVKASGVGQKVAHASAFILMRLKEINIRSTVLHSIGPAIIQPFSFILILALFAFAYKLPSFNLAAFAAVLYLIQKIFTYLQSTQSSIHSIADLVPFAENTLKFKESLHSNRETLSKGEGAPFVFNKELSFHDVSFSYRPGSPVLTGVSFSVPKNSFVGIIGPSGGGKTSLADIGLRLFHPERGEVLLDGVPIDTINAETWQKHVGYVSQDIFLMHASVRDNIRFYDDSVTDEDIERAARQAHIYNDISRLEKGFDTTIGERGTALSGGQRQRVVLARALARSPSLLILDEATSSLDSESEVAIKETIEAIRKTVTLVVIAHRISTIMSADRLLVIKNGTISEEGTPASMSADKDSYLARMKMLQGAL